VGICVATDDGLAVGFREGLLLGLGVGKLEGDDVVSLLQHSVVVRSLSQERPFETQKAKQHSPYSSTEVSTTATIGSMVTS
jgi:hypothetical protein